LKKTRGSHYKEVPELVHGVRHFNRRERKQNKKGKKLKNGGITRRGM
jgi:hypothetical protein